MILLCISCEQVDVAILEVGLGGKYDATNVVFNRHNGQCLLQ